MKNFMILAACAATFYACSSNDVNTPDINENTTGLLSVSTSVLTQNSKGTKTVTENGSSVDGANKGPVMAAGLAKGAEIGVFVFNNNDKFEGYTGATNSIPALNQLWTAGSSDAYTKPGDFTLGIQPAKVYAYFPYAADMKYDKIPVTPGYTDYLYGMHKVEDGTKAVNSTNNAAKITLNHALAMISFTFTKGANYPDEDCQVNAITIKNLPAGGTMSVVGGVDAATIDERTTTLNVSRFNGTAYAPTIGATPWTEWTIANAECNFKKGTIGAVETSGTITTAPLFHALVLPNTAMPGLKNNNEVDTDNLHAVIKIDGVEYKIALAIGKRLPNGTPSNETNEWAANKHYTYNLTISGTSGQGNTLEVSSVTVRQWTAGGSSDIEI